MMRAGPGCMLESLERTSAQGSVRRFALCCDVCSVSLETLGALAADDSQELARSLAGGVGSRNAFASPRGGGEDAPDVLLGAAAPTVRNECRARLARRASSSTIAGGW